jgi:hypothetical protein
MFFFLAIQAAERRRLWGLESNNALQFVHMQIPSLKG